MLLISNSLLFIIVKYFDSRKITFALVASSSVYIKLVFFAKTIIVVNVRERCSIVLAIA